MLDPRAEPAPTPSHATPPHGYGGQAVIEGVMVRGALVMAIAVRRPDGTVALRSVPLSAIHTGPARRVPLLRGVLALWEMLALGMRALTWSAAVAAGDVDERGEARPPGPGGWALLVSTLLVAMAVFFAGPVLLTAWLDRVLPAGWMAVAAEGLLRGAMLVTYVWAIGRSQEIRRVFQYHGAEHMAIHAYEHGRQLTVAAVRRFDRAHPRCGTSFLLTVAIVAMVVFVALGTPPMWWRLLSRLLLIPLIAAFSYELIRFAGDHAEQPLVRWLFAGNLALQQLTTREPEDEQIQVAIAALELARSEDARRESGPAAAP